MAATKKDERILADARKLEGPIPWCEEYEKMICGMLYDSFTPLLEKVRFQARGWCNRYNTWWPHSLPDASFDDLQKERTKQLRQIIGNLGRDVYLEPPLHLDYGCNTRLGDRVYSNFNLTILDCALVTIGDRTMFGPNVSILTATHETDVQSRFDNIEFARPITIENDCWIGAHAVILPGVTIGQGSTIGAGSVVTKDIPAWSIALGTPARVVKKVQPLSHETMSSRESNGFSNALKRMG